MRRGLALVLVSTLVFAVPLADGAGTAKRYRGTFESGGWLTFEVKRVNGAKRVIDYSFNRFRLTCASGPQTTSDFLGFRMRVNDRNRFRANAIKGDPDNPRATLRLRGKLEGRRRAHGNLKIEGRAVPIDAGGTDSCTSSRTRWTARRV